MTRTIPLLILLSLAAPGSAHAQTIAITGATVHTEPGKTVENATVLVRDGVIRGVGKNLAVPRGAQVIDATDRVITAGLIAASSRIGLIEVSAESSTRRGLFDTEPASRWVNASYDVRDSYNPRSVVIPVVRAQGVTSAVIAPAGGVLAGTASCFSLSRGKVADVLVAAGIGMYAPLHGFDQETGWMAITRLRELFDDARLYGRQKAAYNRNQTREFAASRLDLEALQPVLQGRVPLVVRTHRAADIEAAIRLADDFSLRLIIEGGAEAWTVADQLAAANVGVIIDPAQNLPGSFDTIHARDDNARLLDDAGVTLVMANLGAVHNTGTLRQLAGIAVANGLPWERALAAITTAPSDLFGLGRGRIAVGQSADLVVWTGDPFELSSHAERVFIRGEEQDPNNRQRLLFERYRTLPSP